MLLSLKMWRAPNLWRQALGSKQLAHPKGFEPLTSAFGELWLTEIASYFW